MTAETLSLFGDQLLGVALPLYVFDHLGGATASVAVLLARVVPLGLLGFWGGAMADRADRRRLLVMVGMLRAGMVLALLAIDGAGLGLVIVVVIGLTATAQLAGPAVGASLPAVVSPEDLPSANARLAARTVLVGMLAPTLGAAIYTGSGLGAVVALNAGLYALSAVVARALALPLLPAELRESSLLAGMAAGIRLLWDDSVLRRLLVVVVVAMMGLAVELAVIMPFIRGALSGTPTEVGVLTTLQAVGGLLGAVLVPVLARRRGARTLIGVGIWGLPMAALGFLASQVVWQAVPGVLLAGLLVTVLTAGAQTHLQSTVPVSHLGRVLGAVSSAFGIASMVGTGLAVVLTRLVSLRSCLSVAAGIELVAVLLWSIRPPRERRARATVSG